MPAGLEDVPCMEHAGGVCGEDTRVYAVEAAAAAASGDGAPSLIEVGFEQLVVYLAASVALWLLVIILVRVLVFRKSARIPVFRIHPDRREVLDDMETCDWLQAVVNKVFYIFRSEADKGDVMDALANTVNKFMHLSGGKFELHSLDFGEAPPQLCGIEAKTTAPHRHEFLIDVFYQGGMSACFGIEHPVQLPLLGTSMFPMKVFLQSIDLQMRLRIAWDTSAYHTAPPAAAPDASTKRASQHPDPQCKSTLEISLANVPDISMRMSTELGARHVIADSQFLTSVLAIYARRVLQRELLWPKKVLHTFKVPAFAVPGQAAPAARDERRASTGGAAAAGRWPTPQPDTPLGGESQQARAPVFYRSEAAPPPSHDDLRPPPGHAFGMAAAEAMMAHMMPASRYASAHGSDHDAADDVAFYSMRELRKSGSHDTAPPATPVEH